MQHRKVGTVLATHFQGCIWTRPDAIVFFRASGRCHPEQIGEDLPEPHKACLPIRENIAL